MPQMSHVTEILFLVGNQGDWLDQRPASFGQGTKSGPPPVFVRLNAKNFFFKHL